MIKTLLTYVGALFVSQLFAQYTVQFRVTSVYSNVADMDGFLAGDSDPRWQFEFNDQNFSDRFFNYEITANCPGERIVNHLFGSTIHDCNIPNFSGRWRGFEDDVIGSDANTGWLNVNILSANLTVRNNTWTTYSTFEATASGDRCNSVGSSGRVTWRVTLQYKISGNPISTDVMFNEQIVSACHGNKVTLNGVVNTSANWTSGVLNNGQTFNRGVGNTFSVVVEPDLTSTYSVQSISVNNFCNFTSSNVTVNLPNTSGQLATDTESATCYVKAFETVHFFERQSGNYIATVRANDSDLGITTATAYVDATPLHVTACENIDPQYANHVLQRHWVINPTINASAQVRLPFSANELQVLSNFANYNENPSDDIAGVNSLRLSKYSGGVGAVNVNRDPFDNCSAPIGNGTGGTTVHLANQSGAITYLPNMGGHLYASFNIPGFSEFWLHGNSTMIPLNAQLEYADINCNTYSTALRYKYSETNAAVRLMVELSEDGENWLENFMLENTEGESILPNAKYYRIKGLNAFDEESILKYIVNPCTINEMAFYPNPAGEYLYFDLGDFYTQGGVNIEFYDLNGRMVTSFVAGSQKGKMELTQFVPSGFYVVQLTNQHGKVSHVKVQVR